MTDETLDILLVEDGEDDAALFSQALKEAGLKPCVRLARNGAEALAIVFGDGSRGGPPLRPRLIVLDLKLPKVSGLEVLRRIKTTPRTQTIPVVILSSSQENRDLAECYQSGANSYLVKPMDFDEFAELIRLLGRYWLQQNQTQKSEGIE